MDGVTDVVFICNNSRVQGIMLIRTQIEREPYGLLFRLRRDSVKKSINFYHEVPGGLRNEWAYLFMRLGESL